VRLTAYALTASLSLLFLSLLGAPARPAPAAQRLDLPALWRMAQQRFPGLQAARHAVDKAKYQYDEQKWLALPSGELTFFLTGSPSIECTEYPVPGTGAAIGKDACLRTTATPSLLDGNIGKVLPIHGAFVRIDATLTQPLYTFGKLKAARELGRVGLDLARAGAEVTREDLALNVLRAYFGLKTARAAYETIKEGHDQISAWVKRIDKDLERGKGGYTEIDLMRLKVADAQVAMAEIDTERTIKSTLKGLRYLVQDDAADVDGEDLAVAYEETADLSYYLDMALVHRPEVKQLLATGRGAYAYKKLRIAELLPDFGLRLGFGYGYAGAIEDPPLAFVNRFNYLGGAIGLAMRLPLDFGPRTARLQQAQADVRQYEAKRRELLGGVATEVERAFYDLREVQQRLKAAEIAERRARGWLQGVKQNIDVGTAESRDMIDALRAYFDQHLLVLRTINDLNVQSAVMRRLCGLPVIPVDRRGGPK
jgi:outer membrane protein TolC